MDEKIQQYYHVQTSSRNTIVRRYGTYSIRCQQLSYELAARDAFGLRTYNNIIMFYHTSLHPYPVDDNIMYLRVFFNIDVRVVHDVGRETFRKSLLRSNSSSSSL